MRIITPWESVFPGLYAAIRMYRPALRGFRFLLSDSFP